jgi:hypothetical protein
MNKTYVSGPMTGKPDLNFPAFNDAAAKLRAMGHDVVNPAEINPDHTMGWSECMRRDICALMDCNHVVTLPGWQASKGAKIEVRLALDLGMKVSNLADVLAEAQP